MDRNSPDYLLEDTERSLADTEELVLRSREELDRIRFIATPRFVPSTTEKLMTGLGRLCETYDLPVQSHLSENRHEVEWVRELHPNLPSYTAVYDAFGLLRPHKTLMAHAIYLSDEEKTFTQRKRRLPDPLRPIQCQSHQRHHAPSRKSNQGLNLYHRQ